MKVLELMHKLEEAYDRFGDIEVVPDVDGYAYRTQIKGVEIEADQVILEIDSYVEYKTPEHFK